MRYHRAYLELAIPLGMRPLRDVVSPDSLVAARFEPVSRGGKGCGILDLHFRREATRTVIPLVIVDVAMLEARERDPLIWPQVVLHSGIDDFGIARRVERWLGELLADSPLTAESWRIFGDESDRCGFENARAAGFLGAAPLSEVARRAAPFIFARRHARARDVVIACRDAALGAALLAPVARRVRIASEDPSGLAWYATSVSDAQPEIVITDEAHRRSPQTQAARVVIDLDKTDGDVRIEPAPFVPLDVMFDYSGTVRRGERAFSISVTASRKSSVPAVAEEEPVGGSTGRILFVLRRGARRFGGADVDHAELIAAAMRDEGFTVSVIDDLHDAREFAPDFIHAFGVADASQADAARRIAATLDVPFAVHPLYDGAGLGGYWGATVTPYCYRFMHDETSLEQLTSLMRQRRLALNELLATTPFHPTHPHWENDVRAAISGANVVFVGGPSESAAIRGFCEDGDIVTVPPPIAPDTRRPRAVDALVGSEPYVLMHAPLESTQNQVQAVRAAQIADLNLVIAGPVADADYASLVRAFAGDRALLVGDPDEGTLEGLYRGAEVFLDAAWVGCGLARAATALSRGAALAVSNRLHARDLGLGEFLSEIDPADVEGIARGLGDAWYRRHEERREFERVREEFAARAGVREVTRTIVRGYAKALERRNLVAVR